MADEVTVRCSLSVKKDGVDYRSHPDDHRVTLVGTANGPTPGAISVTTSGDSVNLAQLTTPGMCRLRNLDMTNFVSYGTYDGVTYLPLGELGPGEQYVIKLSRTLGTLRLKADTTTCKCLVEAFER